MPPLATTLAIFKFTLDSGSVLLKHKEQVAKAVKYLAKWFTTMAKLMYQSTTAVVALYDTILHGEGGGLRGCGMASCLTLPMGLPAESHSLSRRSWMGTFAYALPH